jgi:predicted metalloendopeptidase
MSTSLLRNWPRHAAVSLLALLAPAAPALAADLTLDEVAAQVLATMDRSADPCSDFYQYACGSWLKTEKRPADRARWSRSFSVIDERNRAIVREILEDAAKNPGDSPETRQVGAFYGSCMDEKAIERAGVTPLRTMFSRIDGVRDSESLLRAAGEMHLKGSGPLLGFGVYPDFKNPGTEIVFMAQGGLGLPDRDYYVSTDPEKKKLLAGYEKHVAEMLALAGSPKGQAARDARAIVAFETELAKVSRPAEAMRELDKMYNKLDLSGLLKLTPSLPWDDFYAAAGAPAQDPQGRAVDLQINVGTPEFFTRLEDLVKTTPYSTLRPYLRWHALNAAAPSLSKAFVDANFGFYGRQVEGQEQIEERWKRCVDATENALGFALGKVYVDREFAGASKATALEMIHDIEEAFEQSLPELSWMDDATRWRSLMKRNRLGNKIGFPDVWRDYSSMKLTPSGYFQNVQAAAEFEARRQAAKIGQPVDRGEWGLTPQTVNAYYNPLLNEIAFPAGILQPPFFHKDFPAAMNYGAIGMVVGHELSHGFDDTGRKFDPSGAMVEWWEPAVAEKFETQANCIRDQYSKFEVLPGLFINGKLTAGENIADNGGLKQAWGAYQLWQARNGGPGPTVPGLSPEQLFFIAHGQVWCTLATEESDRLRVTTDPHSAGRFRVNGPIQNHPAFGAAFGCKLGTPMNPAEKCTVW